MKLFQIFGAIALFLFSASVLGIVLSLVLAIARDDEGIFISTLVISGIIIALAFGIGLIGVALWILGV